MAGALRPLAFFGVLYVSRRSEVAPNAGTEARRLEPQTLRRARFKAKGEISPAPTGGDRRSGRIEAYRGYLLGLIRRPPDMTLLEIQERLIANCGERFSSSVLWRFFDRHDITLKKSPRMPRSSNARTF